MLSIVRREMTSTETYYGDVFWFMKDTADETGEGSSRDCCRVGPRHFQGTAAGDQSSDVFQRAGGLRGGAAGRRVAWRALNVRRRRCFASRLGWPSSSRSQDIFAS